MSNKKNPHLSYWATKLLEIVNFNKKITHFECADIAWININKATAYLDVLVRYNLIVKIEWPIFLSKWVDSQQTSLF